MTKYEVFLYMRCQGIRYCVCICVSLVKSGSSFKNNLENPLFHMDSSFNIENCVYYQKTQPVYP